MWLHQNTKVRCESAHTEHVSWYSLFKGKRQTFRGGEAIPSKHFSRLSEKVCVTIHQYEQGREKKGSSYFPSNRSCSAQVRSLSVAWCLVLMWANSTGSGEAARMRGPLLIAYAITGLLSWRGSYKYHHLCKHPKPFRKNIYIYKILCKNIKLC